MGKRAYREPRSTARVAQEGDLTGALALAPPQRLQLGNPPANLDQVIHGLEALRVLETRNLEDEDLVLGDTARLRRRQRVLQHSRTGEESLGPRRLELMLQLGSRVSDVCR